MKKTRLAAIDIGTNSIRCIVVEVNSKGRFVVMDDEKATVRLGESLNKTGVISQAAFARAIEAVGRMKKLIDGLNVSVVEAVATSAVRKASNGQELVEALNRQLGVEINVISGEAEAELAAISALHNFEMNGKRYAMIDIGGGSVEIIFALGNHIEEYYSFDLGAVLMTEKFLQSDPISEKEYKKFQRHVRSVLKKHVDKERFAIQSLIGSGGTVTSLGGMVMNMRRQSFPSIHGYDVLRSETVHLLAMLKHKDIKARRTVPVLNPDRADIIVAGIGVLDEVMRFIGANTLKINERGIREGLIIKSIRNLGLLPENSTQRTWRDSAMEFARSCNSDENHARHVARISLAIFDRIARENGLKKSDRRLLDAAALLHDIGYFIGYSSHHKHSYHLIHHADLFGFNPREREIIAQIARYHRKALPKKKHKEFELLNEKDQQLVCRLGGILRLADGLDRRRTGLVEVVDIRKNSDTYCIKLLGTEDISVEIFGGNAKRDLFEKAFEANVAFVT